VAEFYEGDAGRRLGVSVGPCAGARPDYADATAPWPGVRRTIAFSEAWDVIHPGGLSGDAMERCDAEGRLADPMMLDAIGRLLESLRSLALLLRSAA
jgi:hypothetical protein